MTDKQEQPDGSIANGPDATEDRTDAGQRRDQFNKVADGIYNGIRKEFGGAAEIEEVQRGNNSAIFGFTVDGVGYSLSVNETP